MSVTLDMMPTSAQRQRDLLLGSLRPSLERLARRLVWDPEDARDVVQSALLDALTHWRTIDDPAGTEAWLRRIVTNRALTYLRRRKFWAAVASLLGSERSPPEAPDAIAERHAHLARLGRAVSSLSAKQAAAFSLRYLEGLSLDETADALAMNRGTVRVHLQRAVAALRNKGVL